MSEATKSVTISQSKLAELNDKYIELLQENLSKQQRIFQPPQVTQKGSKLHQQLLELQQASEDDTNMQLQNKRYC